MSTITIEQAIDDVEAATAVTEKTEISVKTIVLHCMHIAIGAALAYGAFSVLVLFCWKWLAVVLALLASVFAERVVLKLADKQIDAAAEVTANALVAGFGWLKGAFAQASK